MASIVAYTNDPNTGKLPRVLMIDLSDRDVELALDSGRNRTQHSAFVLEASVLGHTKIDTQNSNIHVFSP